MAKQWTDEEVQAEIAAAVKIVAEDRERASYLALHSKYGEKSEEETEDEGEPGKKPPPAKKKKDEEDQKPVKKSLWWGEAINDE